MFSYRCENVIYNYYYSFNLETFKFFILFVNNEVLKHHKNIFYDSFYEDNKGEEAHDLQLFNYL